MSGDIAEKKVNFPNKEARTKCWSARDSFWECVDKDAADGSCQELRKVFEKACPPLWVKHFDRKKEYIAFQQKLEEGYEPITDQKL